MRIWIVAATLLLGLALSGCDSQSLMNKFGGLFVPADETRAAQGFIEDIRKGDAARAAAAIDPIYKDQLNEDFFRKVRPLFDQGPVKSVKVVGSQSFTTSQYTRYVVTYEYETAKHWLLVQVILQKVNGRRVIEGVRFQQMGKSLEQLNAFTFVNKSPAALTVLALAVLIPVFVVWIAIVCWRTPIPKRKWLWRIFVLFGIMGINLNWTSGALQFVPLQINLLGAAYTQALFGPVIIQIGFPLGAILFWVRRRAWLRRAEEASAAAAEV